MYLLLFLVVFGFVIWAIVSVVRRARFKALMDAPFPVDWEAILNKNLPPYPYLPEKLKNRLHSYINVFLAEKNFEGCSGQEITDEVRVTIASQACLLLIGRDSKCYPKLRSVLVYPHTYVASGSGDFGGDDGNFSKTFSRKARKTRKTKN